MPVAVRDVVDTVKMLGDVVESTREIVKAINDGAVYLKRKHPNAKQDVGDLLAQMHTTVVGLAEVTKIVTSFRFVVSDLSVSTTSAESELARFNGYVIEREKYVEELMGKIGTLKGNCEKVRALCDDLDAKAKSSEQGAMFKLFGLKVDAQARTLHSSLSMLYGDDQHMIMHIEEMLAFATNALKDVNDALGPPGMQHPFNIPRAAALLGAYSKMMSKSRKELHSLAIDLQITAKAFAK